jgi:hypothetical protein
MSVASRNSGTEAAVVRDVLGTLRRLLLALIAVGLTGTATELVLLEHYEEGWQILPLALLAMALAAVAAQAFVGTAATLRALRGAMALLIVAGALGVLLHYRGNLEFQADMDPTLSQWELFKKVIRAKAPPALAPGSMVQIGLLGLVYSYRHPVLTRDQSRRSSGA